MAAKKKDEIRSLALIHIIQDPRLQLRVDLDDQGYIQSMTDIIEADGELRGDLPAVFYDGQTNWLADGNQRLEAHKLANKKKMSCLVRQGSFRDAWEYAMQANAEHGKKRSNADKRNVVEMAFLDSEWQSFSDAVIAERCKVSVRYVCKVRAELTRNVPSQQAEKREGLDGRICNVSNIGKAQPTTSPSAEISAKEKEIRDAIAHTPEVDDIGIAARCTTSAAQVEMVRSDILKEELASAPHWDEMAFDTADTDDGAEDAEPTRVPTDSKKKPIPPQLLPAFERAGELRNTNKQLTAIIAEVRAMKADGIGSRWLDVRSFEAAIKDAQVALRMGAPYIVCCECGGKKYFLGADCPLCKGEGYLPRNAWNNLTPEQQEAASVWDSTSGATE